MQRKLLGIISVGFDITGPLVIRYSAFLNTREKMGIQWGGASAISRLQESI
jgi:hypothetical protein